MTENQHDLLTVGEAAKLTGRSRQTISFWIREGRLAVHGVSDKPPRRGASLIRRGEVLALCEERPSHRTRPKLPPPEWRLDETTGGEPSPMEAVRLFQEGLVTELRAARMIAGRDTPILPAEWAELKRLLRLTEEEDELSEAA